MLTVAKTRPTFELYRLLALGQPVSTSVQCALGNRGRLQSARIPCAQVLALHPRSLPSRRVRLLARGCTPEWQTEAGDIAEKQKRQTWMTRNAFSIKTKTRVMKGLKTARRSHNSLQSKFTCNSQPRDHGEPAQRL